MDGDNKPANDDIEDKKLEDLDDNSKGDKFIDDKIRDGFERTDSKLDTGEVR